MFSKKNVNQIPRMTHPRKTICVVRNLRRLLAIILVAPVLALAEEVKLPSAHFHGSVGVPVPNVNLPPTIPADEGKLTIYADFEKAKEGKVPLYLVNRTGEQIMFPSQDRDIYLKLERRLSDGRWERVQFHQDSWCGNSYSTIKLAPGSHFAFSGYLPTKGTKARVRFRSYGSISLVSNEGEGFFLEEDRLAAGLDQMALRELPNSLQIYFKFDPDKPQRAGNTISDETFLSALRLVSSYRENRYVRRTAEAFLGATKETDSNSPKVAAAIRDILGRKWPAEAEADLLFKAAFEELPDHPIPAWAVLNELLREGIDPSTGDEAQFGRSVAEELEKALYRDNASEIVEVARLIGSPRFAGEHYDDAFLKKWIRSPHDVLVRECANALSRRKKFDELAEIGSELEPNAQLILLRALASSGSPELGTSSSRNPRSKIERHFWISCASEQPIQSVSALYYIGIRGDYNRFNLTLHEPLREFLIREANTPSDEIDGWKLGKVVAFVGNWKRKEDVSLFQSLLEHPAYQRSEGTKSTRPGVRLEFRRYRVRVEARRILIGMGESVPEGIVLKEERVIP